MTYFGWSPRCMAAKLQNKNEGTQNILSLLWSAGKDFDSRLKHNDLEMTVLLKGLIFIAFPPGISSEKVKSNLLRKINFRIHFAHLVGILHYSVLFGGCCFIPPRHEQPLSFSQLGLGRLLLMTCLGKFWFPFPFFFFLRSDCHNSSANWLHSLEQCTFYNLYLE